MPELAALADANDAEFFDHLAPKDRAALLRVLREIVEKRSLKSMPLDWRRTPLTIPPRKDTDMTANWKDVARTCLEGAEIGRDDLPADRWHPD